MWCKACRQDVPALGSTSQPGLVCARCGTRFDSALPGGIQRSGLSTTATHGVSLDQPVEGPHDTGGFDDWEIEQNMRRLRARVGPWQRTDASASSHDAPTVRMPPTAAMRQRRRIDGSHGRKVRSPHPSRRDNKSSRGGIVAWGILALGLMAFACGGVLLGMSIVQQRPQLWSLGLPIIVAGKVGMLIGLVMQLERMWQNSRQAAHKLEQVDRQLHQLQRTTTMLGVTHNSASQAYYAHMAADANPEILLADLKGQIDLLARSMARRSA